MLIITLLMSSVSWVSVSALVLRLLFLLGTFCVAAEVGVQLLCGCVDSASEAASLASTDTSSHASASLDVYEHSVCLFIFIHDYTIILIGNNSYPFGVRPAWTPPDVLLQEGEAPQDEVVPIWVLNGWVTWLPPMDQSPVSGPHVLHEQFQLIIWK